MVHVFDSVRFVSFILHCNLERQLHDQSGHVPWFGIALANMGSCDSHEAAVSHILNLWRTSFR